MLNILFFSYLSHDEESYKGGAWVTSLAKLLVDSGNYRVAIAYISHKQNIQKFEKDSIVYYPIFVSYTTLTKFKMLYLNRVRYNVDFKDINSIVESFAPDIIQLFGIETPFGEILRNVACNKPIVVHIQGIAAAILPRWFPMGFSRLDVWRFSRFKQKILRLTSSDFYNRFRKWMLIERDSFHYYRYYLGRTSWDYQISRLLSPTSKYFVCNEVLRPQFYKSRWIFKNRSEIILSTILNGEIYKGFDTILRTAHLLSQLKISYHWHIYGVFEDFPLKTVIEKITGCKFCDTSVSFDGTKSADELVTALLDTTFYVHPSHIDNSPNSLSEAMIMGVPCIAAYVGGVPSMLTDGLDGFLFPDSDHFPLAYLISSYGHDETTLTAISNKAYLRASTRHNPKEILLQLDSAYSQIINDHKVI